MWVRTWGAAGVLAALMVLCTSTARADDIVVVVVSERAPVYQLSVGQVRAIFLGVAPFHEGVRTRPVAYSEHSRIMELFLEQVLEMPAKEYKGWWVRRIFREGDAPPIRAGSTADALHYIMVNPGGIGFVYEQDLNGDEGVRAVLRILPKDVISH